jgi:hypothetical protein
MKATCFIAISRRSDDQSIDISKQQRALHLLNVSVLIDRTNQANAKTLFNQLLLQDYGRNGRRS